MKRLFLYIFLCILLLTGCSKTGQSDETGKQNTFPLRVTAILPHDDALTPGGTGYWTIVAEGAVAAAKEYGVDVKVIAPPINYNIEQITELIYQEVYAKADAIIVQGIDDDNYIAALQTANGAGIQVVLVDTDADVGFDHLYVGTDNLAAGRSLGEYICGVTDGRTDIFVISGGIGYPNVAERLQGLAEVIETQPGMRILDVGYDNYDSLTVMEEYERMRKQYPQADTLVCLEGTGGQTLSYMLQPEDCTLDYIFAFDKTQEVLHGLENGLITAILVQDQEQMGYLAVQELCRYFEEGCYSNSILHTPTDILTWEEVGENGR